MPLEINLDLPAGYEISQSSSFKLGDVAPKATAKIPLPSLSQIVSPAEVQFSSEMVFRSPVIVLTIATRAFEPVPCRSTVVAESNFPSCDQETARSVNSLSAPSF